MTPTVFPPYVVIDPGDRPDVDIPRGTRFVWNVKDLSLSIENKVTPELLTELVETGALQGIQALSVPEWCITMTGLPDLPDAVTQTLKRVSINSSKFVDWSGLYALTHLESL
ncbi:MAG: hypothetical protein AAFX99_25580, partial [Myxococcota bacterium]